MKDITVGKIQGHVSLSFPALLLGVSPSYCHRGMVGELEMIRTQTGKHNRTVMVVVYSTHCAIPPRKNRKSIVDAKNSELGKRHSKRGKIWKGQGESTAAKSLSEHV
jgi:hypothetical protein